MQLIKEMVMNGEKGAPAELQIERSFKQSSDAISFYCDYAQVMATENEVVMQLYETIPGLPDSDGKLTKAVSRLRATVTLSISHAKNVGKVLVERTKVDVK
jgi:hypothetical protein